MNNKPPRKLLRLTPRRVTRCAGALCGGAELNVPLEESFDKVLFCGDCYDAVYGHEEDGSDAPEGLYWFVTHVDHGVIAGSSRPDIVRPTPPPLGLCTVVPPLHPAVTTTPDTPGAANRAATAAAAAAASAAVVKAARYLARADAVLVMAGAGASIDSDLPDFRGRSGWYSLGSGAGSAAAGGISSSEKKEGEAGKENEEAEEEEMISMEHVDFHPGSPHLLTAWRLKIAMVQAFQRAAPHQGYLDLVQALWGSSRGRDDAMASSSSSSSDSSPTSGALLFSEEDSLQGSSSSSGGGSGGGGGGGNSGESNAFVITSNIDGFFERAGVPPASLYETHGTVHRFQCTSVGTPREKACPRSGDVWEIPASERAVLEDKAAAATAVAAAARRRLKGSESGSGSGSESKSRAGAGAAGAAGGAVARGGCGLGAIRPLKLRDLPRCPGCRALARPNVSHTTDSDEDICPARKAAQRERALAWIERQKQQRRPSSSSSSSSRSSSTTTTTTRSNVLVVLEVGCGVSEHSLRLDTEVVVARHREAGGEAYLVRVDPAAASVPAGGGHVGVPLGAKDALIAIVAAARAEKAKAKKSGSPRES